MIYHSMILLRKLDSSLDLARTQATGANINTLNLALNNGTNTLNVWLPGTLGLQVGMADIVAAQLTLTAYFTYTCHVTHLLIVSMSVYGLHTQYENYNTRSLLIATTGINFLPQKNRHRCQRQYPLAPDSLQSMTAFLTLSQLAIIADKKLVVKYFYFTASANFKRCCNSSLLK